MEACNLLFGTSLPTFTNVIKPAVIHFENEKDGADQSSAKGEENDSKSNDASTDTSHHGDFPFGSEAGWKTVGKRQKEAKACKYEPSNAQQTSRGRGQRGNSRAGFTRGRGNGRGFYNPPGSHVKNPEKTPNVEARGRSGRGQRVGGFGRGTQRNRGRGDGVPSRWYDPVSRGFILKGVRYEKNKLYVLGLHFRVTKECLLHYIEKISDYEVKHILWFKPHGRAIVTLDKDITDFERICEEAERRPLTFDKGRKDDVSDLRIERAPVCKSIFVREIPENTTQEEVEEYFEKFGIVETFRSNMEEVKAGRFTEKRAIVYFKSEKSVRKILDNDNFIDDNLLHVERYYPFMGIVEPVDSKRQQNPPSKIPVSEDPFFRMGVEADTIEFVMDKSNQGLELQQRLFEEHANINWTNKDGYVLVKYNSKGHKLDDEFDEDDWVKRCRDIISGILDRFTMKDIPVEKEIWKQVINQLPQIEALFPNFTAQVKQFEDLKGLRLICLKRDLPMLEKKLLNRLDDIKQAELEKTLEHRTLTDIPNEKLKLMDTLGIQNILKNDVHQDIQAKIELARRSIFIKTPEGQMSSAVTYLRQREEEVEQNSMQSPPEIIAILKTKVGKRKLNNEFKEANVNCTFNVDEKNKRVLFFGRTLEDTVKGRRIAETVLVTGKLPIKDRDNHVLQSDEWKQLCRDFEKRSKISCQRGSVTEFHVFGLKQDVDEAMKAMTKFLNEKKAKEGEFRFNSPVNQRLFHEFYNEEIMELEGSLSSYSVKISSDENGDLHFTGAVEGVKKVTKRLNVMQDTITEKTVNMTLPGMRSFLAKNKGELIGAVEKEHKCVFEIEESKREDQGQDEIDEVSSVSSDEEPFDEADDAIVTQEGKKITWKIGNIEKEEAGVLVCSVGSNLKLFIGGVARAFNDAAGPSLQLALNDAANNYLGPGEIAYVTLKSGNLPCDHVVFCVCCPWSEGKSDAKQTLKSLLWKSFDATSQLGSGSIALPLIGTGTLNFPHDVAIQVMVDEALSYSNKFPDSPIEEFRFIVHNEDQEGILTFEEKFRHFKEDPQRTFPPPRKRATGHSSRKPKETLPLEPRCTKAYIGDVSVEVVKGDITNECSDGIISVVREDLQMKHGKLSAAILEVCGSAVQEELSENLPLPSGSAVLTSAGEMKAKWIIHMVVGSGNKQHLLNCVETALKVVQCKGLKSVSIPAIGSGGLGLSPRDSAEVVLESVRTFLENENHGTVPSIRIVVLEDSVMDVFAKQLNTIKREVGQASGFIEEDYEEGEADAKSTSWCYQHKVTVYGRQEVLEEAITALKNGVIEECASTDITDEVIGRLPKRCKRHLREKAREEDVGLDLSKPGTIALRGFSSDVIRMHTEVSKVLQEQLKEEHRMERAELTSQNVQWCFLTVAGKQEPFEKMANYDIETAHRSNKPSVSFSNKKWSAEIIFDRCEVTFVKTGAVKKIFRKEVIPLPRDWDCHPKDAKGREEKVHLVRLETESSEYKAVHERFMKSISEKAGITSIQRIQNPSMYRSYVTKKQSMDEKNGNHRNEWHLFHGTGYHNVNDINAHGLNRSFCGSNGAALGDGVYFATESSYSKYFSNPPNAKGERCMYLAKVLVGKYTRGDNGMKQPPAIDSDRPELLFDSVVDSIDDPEVFVVFHDDQCYPEYLITFKLNSG